LLVTTLERLTPGLVVQWVLTMVSFELTHNPLVEIGAVFCGSLLLAHIDQEWSKLLRDDRG